LVYALRGGSEAKEFGQTRVVIGRNPDCDLVLTARDVSRVHAAIDRDDEG
jgi:pSer/pThr/pTyr-binding forkhead associated (FHA) protein